MAKHLAQARLERVLHHRTPPDTDRTHNLGEKVLVWRENVVENRIGEWVGPYRVISFDAQAKIVLVQKDPDSQQER